MHEPTKGSLFSGCGGTALGFERAGFKTVWFVERDPYAQAVLRKNFPGAVIYGDITAVDFTKVPRVDVLEGGFPCQDISNAGKRAGIEGSRSSLWKDFARAIRDLRPRFVSIENVAALVGRGLEVVLCDLAALGYDAEWHCISAAAVGAPHRRDRIFILAYDNSRGRVHGQAAEHATEGRKQALSLSRSRSETLPDTDCERCHGGSDHQSARHLLRDEFGNASQSECEWSRWECRSSSTNAFVSDATCERAEQLSTGSRGEGERETDINRSREDVYDTYSERFGRDSWSRQDLHSEQCSSERQNVDDVRDKGNEVSNAYRGRLERTEAEGRVISNVIWENGERDGWWSVEPEVGRVAHGVPSRVDRIKCLGNAVVPQNAEVIAETIKQAIANGKW